MLLAARSAPQQFTPWFLETLALLGHSLETREHEVAVDETETETGRLRMLAEGGVRAAAVHAVVPGI